MTHDPDDSADIKSEDPSRFGTNPFDKQPRPQPSFGGFGDHSEDNDGYEEPDRDTDYASAYGEESFVDDGYEDLPDLDDDTLDEPGDTDGAGTDEPLAYEEALEVSSPPHEQRYSERYDDEEPDEPDDEQPESDLTYPASLYATRDSGAEGFATEDTDEHWQEPEMAENSDDDEWTDDEDYQEVNESHHNGQPWPLGLIAVAVLALLLLTAGGYGVMQQRSATQEEIRQLRAVLATAANPEDVSEIRTALQAAKQNNSEMTAQLDALRLENRRLSDTVNGLEAQQAAIAKQAAEAIALKKASPKPTPPVSKPAVVATTTGSWFVNFGSYGQSDIAQQWVHKLKPGSGEVITAPSVRDGKTFYRVRVINLPSRTSAEKISRTLEREYGLPKLWIGQQK
jgi:cell division septation protein DedD